jgi:hypothetical protein
MALRLLALLAVAIRPALLGVQTKRRHRLAVGGEAHLGEVADEAAQLKVVGLHEMVPFSPFGDCWLFMACQHQAGLSQQSKLVTLERRREAREARRLPNVIHFDGWRPSGRVQRHGRPAARRLEGTPIQKANVSSAASETPPWGSTHIGNENAR